MSVKCEFKKSNKFVNILFSCFKYIFCIYRMYLISAEGYENAEVDTLTKKKNWWNVGEYKRRTQWFRS